MASADRSIAPAGSPRSFVNPYLPAPVRAIPAATRFTVPTPVHVGSGESVQVELMPPMLAAKARSVITYEAVQDLSANYQAYPAMDCTMLNATAPGSGRADVALEIDVPNAKQLPDGRVRVFKRAANTPDRIDVVGEDQLLTSAGTARIRLASHTELVGERHAKARTLDERTRTITEKIEVKLENKSKQPAGVVIREFLWRAAIWRIDPGDESIKGVRAGPHTQEYRLGVPAGGHKSVTYTVVYSW